MHRPGYGLAEGKPNRTARKHLRTPHKLVLALSGSLVLSACSTHLYNAETDAAAKAANTRFAAIDLTNAVMDERKNLQEQFVAELETSRKWALARSRYEVAALFDASASSATARPKRIADSLAQFSAPQDANVRKSYLLRRIEKLGLSAGTFDKPGHGDKIYKLASDLREQSGKFQMNFLRVDLLRDRLSEDYGLARLTCAKILAADTDEKKTALVATVADPQQRGSALETVRTLNRLCRPVSLLKLDPSTFARGEILKAFRDYQIAVVTLEDAKKKRDDFKAGLEQKKAEIKALEKDGSTDPAESEKQIREKAAEIRKFLTEASGVLDASSFKGAEAVGERLAAIDCVLAAAATPVEPPAADGDSAVAESQADAVPATGNSAICPDMVGEDGTTPQSLAVLATIASASPSLTAKFKTLKNLDLQPAVLARLRAEKQRLSIEHDYFKDLVELAETGVSLQRAYYAALVDEANYFRDIYLGWKNYRSDSGKGEHTVSCALGLETCSSPPVGVQRQIIARAVLNYASSISDARARQLAAKQGLTQVLHLQALRADELVIADWNSLIQPALTQLAAYHASGVKKETVASITQGLINLGLLGVLVSKE